MNKVCLIGRLTKDPETRYTQSNNTLVANFTIAVNRRFAKETDDVHADFIPIIAWAKTGEFCCNYFRKGQQVGIVGRIQTRNWEDEQGEKHYATEVVAEEVYFADSKRDYDNEFGGTFGSSSNLDMKPDFEVSNASDDLPF